MHQDALRQYEDRLLLCARDYSLDLTFLKKNFAGEYQHVARKVVSTAPYTEALAKDSLRMIGLQ